MTPKEKAQELFTHFYMILFMSDTDKGEECTVSILAIKCALIAVQESRNEVGDLSNDYRCKERIEFWQEVEKELKAM